MDSNLNILTKEHTFMIYKKYARYLTASCTESLSNVFFICIPCHKLGIFQKKWWPCPSRSPAFVHLAQGSCRLEHQFIHATGISVTTLLCNAILTGIFPKKSHFKFMVKSTGGEFSMSTSPPSSADYTRKSNFTPEWLWVPQVTQYWNVCLISWFKYKNIYL